MAEIGPRTTGWTATDFRTPDPLASWRGRLVRSALDLLIAIDATDLALVAITGGVDLGVLTLHEPAKPVFVLRISQYLNANPSIRKFVIVVKVYSRADPC